MDIRDVALLLALWVLARESYRKIHFSIEIKRGIGKSSKTAALQKEESRRHSKNNTEKVEEESPRQAS